jgi:hypothetical protein
LLLVAFLAAALGHVHGAGSGLPELRASDEGRQLASHRPCLACLHALRSVCVQAEERPGQEPLQAAGTLVPATAAFTAQLAHRFTASRAPPQSA